jgi:hypothetical protein
MSRERSVILTRVSRTVRYGILHDATDEAALYELTWRSTSHVGRQTIDTIPRERLTRSGRTS